MATVQTKFFCFAQNNSGGRFYENPERGIGQVVWIEAIDAAHANSRAQSIGLYFGGVAQGIDCACCGDRWAEAWGSDDGDDAPRLNDYGWRDGPTYVHRIDGTFEVAPKPDGAA